MVRLLFKVQTVICETADDSTAEFTLSFRDETTDVISGAADAATVQTALEALATIGSVTVAFTDGAQNACGDGSQNMTVTFTSELGELPSLVGAAVTNVDAIDTHVSAICLRCALLLCGTVSLTSVLSRSCLLVLFHR